MFNAASRLNYIPGDAGGSCESFTPTCRAVTISR